MCSSLCYGPARTTETFVDSLASWHPTQTAPQILVEKEKTFVQYAEWLQVIQENTKLFTHNLNIWYVRTVLNTAHKLEIGTWDNLMMLPNEKALNYIPLRCRIVKLLCALPVDAVWGSCHKTEFLKYNCRCYNHSWSWPTWSYYPSLCMNV